ncbi:ABC transporter permease [Catelliglobosispora koreensis]|uniref:ABC transporter permease n=1 Tax=Catelliglobosispora koreensis TaxID=129052 RepID=UPI00058D733C
MGRSLLTPDDLKAARLSPADVSRVGLAGLRSRPLRVVLSALGIAIGIAAMLSVVGISASSRAGLDRTLSQLGTNLLTVAPGNTIYGADARLPTESVAMVRRIGPVQTVTAIGRVPAGVYRNDLIPAGQTGGIAVNAARLDLLETAGAGVATGTWLNAATAEHPAVVLGSKASTILAVRTPGMRVWLGGQWFSVAGTLSPVPLAPELDLSVLVGWPAAQRYLGFDGHPTTIYTRSRPDAVEAVRGVLAATVNPLQPNEVKVSRPSDALTAQRATNRALDALLTGLGAVALLVGGIGVANTMVMNVLERRSEIGLRRSLGATRGQIRLQFLAESLLLSAAGGIAGALVSSAIIVWYAGSKQWPVAIPGWAIAGAIVAALGVGVAAGLYPAIRAARLTPTEALFHG